MVSILSKTTVWEALKDMCIIYMIIKALDMKYIETDFNFILVMTVKNTYMISERILTG